MKNTFKKNTQVSLSISFGPTISNHFSQEIENELAVLIKWRLVI